MSLGRAASPVRRVRKEAHSYSCREARLTYRASLVLVCYVNFTDVAWWTGILRRL